MNIMKNLKKSWKTSLIGVLIIAYNLYNFLINGVEIDFTSVVSMLIGLGFFWAEDADASHSLNRTIDPDKKEYPKRKF